MVLEALSPYFLQPWGLLALLSLIPLIIIYLKKPKPKHLFFPSLEFLTKRDRKKITASWLSRILDDPLFLLQLLILAVLSAATAYPYFLVSQTDAAEEAVIIIDVSGSMQAKFDGTTRLEKAMRLAEESLGTANTVILAGDFPTVLADRADRGAAARLIRAITPRATETNLYDAMILGDDYAGEGGKAVVISDFLHNANSKSLATARNILESKGIAVQYKNVAGTVKNVGIVGIEPGEKEIKVRVRNFMQEAAGMKVRYGNQTKEVSLAPVESALLTFAAERGMGRIQLEYRDDFELDNTAYVSVPEKAQVNALLVTSKESRYLPTAFSLIEGVRLDKAILPVVDDFDYDLFIMQNIDRDKLLPGTVEAIFGKVKDGASLILVSQEDLGATGLAEKAGITLGQRINSAAVVQKIDSELTEAVEFGSAGRYFNATGIGAIAYVQAGNATVTVIGEKPLGKGRVLYFGLEEPSSSFHFELMYPVFWKRTLEKFFGRLGTGETNYQTGDILTFDGPTSVRGPDGSATVSKSAVLDQAGFYEAGGKLIAVNMESEQESDVSGALTRQDADVQAAKGEGKERKVPYDITSYLAMAALILVLAELAIIKYRGDV